ncbi:hypothetical protein LZQ00_16445 [Sphingobacterium sp. SRCM116780]|uniref:hypothetical protein n=1 Tax=Sphingobacterium sp. SRCM116780 TaxID=2907623 RepID=UPI001F315274|nr:hypothetical protein [Sphingobacterium sp. SRCM116780]UIR55837.1 hypothetical protein LZQ00_16445 [Sphingobacterium sp. SRCM116780]
MKTIWKWIIGVIVTLLIIVGSLAWYFSVHWKPLLDQKFKELVLASTDSLYTVTYDDLDINLALGNVSVSNLILTSDSTIYRRLEKINKAPDNRFQIKVAKLKFRNFSIRDMLMNKELYLKNVVLDTPSIHMINEYHSYNDTASAQVNKPLYEKIKKTLKKIQIKEIELNGINFKYSQLQKNIYQDFEIKKVNLKVQDVLVDSTSISDESRFYHTKMIDIEVPGFTYKTADGFYKVDFDKLKINTRDRNILLTKVVYQPILNKSAFYKKKGKGGSYIVMKFDTVRFESFDFKKLLRDKKIYATKTQLKNGLLEIYSDKHYQSKPVNKIGRSPHQRLLKMNTKLSLDTVLLQNTHISYSELSGKYNQVGTITFDKSYATISNMTNDSSTLAKNKWMKVDFLSRVMNSGRLNVLLGFDMTSKEGFYTYKGSLGAMQAPAFNKILKPLLNVEIASGNIKRMSFDMEANDRRNWGQFKFDYDNLKVNILGKNADGKLKKKGLVSLLINELLFNTSNPNEFGEYITGRVNWHRNPNHTFFKTIWQSLLDGIKQCVGLSKEREAKLMRAAENAQNTIKKANTVVNKTKSFVSRIFKKDAAAIEQRKKEKELKKKAKEEKKQAENKVKEREEMG